MITISIRETVKVINHELCIRLPETFNCDEVDVIIFPRMKDVSWDVSGRGARSNASEELAVLPEALLRIRRIIPNGRLDLSGQNLFHRPLSSNYILNN